MPYWESLHTHTSIVWVKLTIEKFLSAGKFMLIEYLTLFHMLVYFGPAIWLFLKVYMCVLISCWRPNLVLLSCFCFDFWLWFFNYTLFTLCPFKTKRGSIFLFWTGNVFLNRLSVFVPEWPNGEFVSILCWQHYGWQKHFM
jgi:hypothetical protein